MPSQSQRARFRYLGPTMALTAAGAMLAISLFLPYWELTLVAADHPQGLRLVSYLAHIEGPLDVVLASAGRPAAAGLQELSQLERSLAAATVTVICLLVVAATFVHSRWAALLSLPALCFPLIVIADSARWLGTMVAGISGTSGPLPSLSPLALFGRLVKGGVSLETRPGAGLILAVAASLTVIAGLWLHRNAYRVPSDDRELEQPHQRPSPPERAL
jgi:copper chaperone NosL